MKLSLLIASIVVTSGEEIVNSSPLSLLGIQAQCSAHTSEKLSLLHEQNLGVCLIADTIEDKRNIEIITLKFDKKIPSDLETLRNNLTFVEQLKKQEISQFSQKELEERLNEFGKSKSKLGLIPDTLHGPAYEHKAAIISSFCERQKIFCLIEGFTSIQDKNKLNPNAFKYTFELDPIYEHELAVAVSQTVSLTDPSDIEGRKEKIISLSDKLIKYNVPFDQNYINSLLDRITRPVHEKDLSKLIKLYKSLITTRFPKEAMSVEDAKILNKVFTALESYNEHDIYKTFHDYLGGSRNKKMEKLVQSYLSQGFTVIALAGSTHIEFLQKRIKV